MNEVIIQDINNLVESLYYTYNSKFELNDLLKRYIPNISIEKKSEKIKNKKKIKCKKKKKNYIPHISNRCIARCWGGQSSVLYNPITKKWTYGRQCSRYKSKGKYCLTHYKQSISSLGLTHGIFTDPPPHPHYLKYKNKIELKFNLKY